MKSERLALVLLAAGVALIIGAIFWSLYAYGLVGQLVISKGVRANGIAPCLVWTSEYCSVIADAHREKGTTAYSPLMLWAGVVAVIASFVINFRSYSPGEGWGPRLERLLIPVDRVSAFMGQLFAWCIVILTFAVSYEVVMRKIFRAPTEWAYDVSYILYGALFIMAGAYTLSRNAHVRGDFLYRSWSPKNQARMDLVLYFVFFFPAIMAFIYSGYGFAAQAWLTHEHSAYSPGGPPIYHYKTLIPVTGVLLLLQGIVEVIRCLDCLKTGEWPQRLHDVEELEKILLEQRAAEEAKP
jgi:TRAP-type mannitol/chloroaromatic compound transport system permease small subunit